MLTRLDICFFYFVYLFDFYNNLLNWFAEIIISFNPIVYKKNIGRYVHTSTFPHHRQTEK